MRATGRTFRVILKAALALSEGQDTVIVCLNYKEAARTIREVLEICNLYGLVSHPLFSYAKYGITFMDTKLRTIAPHDRNSPTFKGSNYNIIEDY